MKESFGGLEFGLTEMCFPSPGLEHKLKVIFEVALLHNLHWPLLWRKYILIYCVESQQFV